MITMIVAIYILYKIGYILAINPIYISWINNVWVLLTHWHICCKMQLSMYIYVYMYVGLMGYIYIYPKKLQFAAYGQFVLVVINGSLECHASTLKGRWKFDYFNAFTSIDCKSKREIKRPLAVFNHDCAWVSD